MRLFLLAITILSSMLFAQAKETAFVPLQKGIMLTTQYLAECFQYTITGDVTKEYTITTPAGDIILQNGNTEARCGDKTIILPVPPTVVFEQACIPVVVLEKLAGVTVRFSNTIRYGGYIKNVIEINDQQHPALYLPVFQNPSIFTTPAHLDAFNGNTALLREHLKDRTALNATDSRKLTPLHVAMAAGQQDIVQLLLQAGAKPDCADDYNHSPMWTAILAEKPEMVLYLHDAGVPFDDQAISLAVDKGMMGLVDSALADPKKPIGSATLVSTVNAGQIVLVNKILDQGVPVNDIDGNGRSPLIYAAMKDNEDIVTLLLAKGADVNKVNEKWSIGWSASFPMVGISFNRTGMSPLHMAVTAAKESIIQQLIEHGANVKFSTVDGLTLHHCAVLSKYNSSGSVTKLLQQNGCPLGVTTNFTIQIFTKNKKTGDIVAKKFTALHLAILCRTNCSPELVSALLDAGDDINAKTSNGMTPLHMAVLENNIAVVKLLVEKGAKLNVEMDGGITPLKLAEQVGVDNQIINLLSQTNEK